MLVVSKEESQRTAPLFRSFAYSFFALPWAELQKTVACGRAGLGLVASDRRNASRSEAFCFFLGGGGGGGVGERASPGGGGGGESGARTGIPRW